LFFSEKTKRSTFSFVPSFLPFFFFLATLFFLAFPKGNIHFPRAQSPVYTSTVPTASRSRPEKKRRNVRPALRRLLRSPPSLPPSFLSNRFTSTLVLLQTRADKLCPPWMSRQVRPTFSVLSSLPRSFPTRNWCNPRRHHQPEHAHKTRAINLSVHEHLFPPIIHQSGLFGLRRFDSQTVEFLPKGINGLEKAKKEFSGGPVDTI